MKRGERHNHIEKERDREMERERERERERGREVYRDERGRLGQEREEDLVNFRVGRFVW